MLAIYRGYHPHRSPDLYLIPRPPNYFGSASNWTHSGPWRYLQNVPLVFYGPGVVRAAGPVAVPGGATLADVAPTLSSVLPIDWPARRSGSMIDGVFARSETGAASPRLVSILVWDGVGDNVLSAWPRSWPYLSRLMRRGVSVTNATAGSSPSVTPAIHATLGTGTYPRSHGIVDAKMRFRGSPRDVRIESQLITPTLADIYDAQEQNDPKVAMVAGTTWELGMMGVGSRLAGGDRDVAVMWDEEGKLQRTVSGSYRHPAYAVRETDPREYARQHDAADGRIDGTWRGHDIAADPEAVRNSPAWIPYQVDVIKRVMAEEHLGRDSHTDLLLVNFKQADVIGHIYNMVNVEVRDAIEELDVALRELVTAFNRFAGKRKWVLVVTADHGQTPSSDSSGGWPINEDELQRDIAVAMRTDPTTLFEATRPTSYWFKASALKHADATLEEIATMLLRYRIRDNVVSGAAVPGTFSGALDRKLFDAVFPSRYTTQAARCNRTNGKYGGG